MKETTREARGASRARELHETREHVRQENM